MKKSAKGGEAQPASLQEIADSGTKLGEIWELRLYIAGQTPRSIAAFANLKKICEQHLQGRYNIEVVDLVKHPQLAAGDQNFAMPPLVREKGGRKHHLNPLTPKFRIPRFSLKKKKD